MGNTGAFHWEKVNGRWWAFGAEGYLSTGWIYDTLYQGWFYMDENQGMLTGWQFINGKWYYFDAEGYMATGWINVGGVDYCLAPDGALYVSCTTPDGYNVDANGAWIH